MPKLVDPKEVKKYALAFGKEPKLSSCGFSFMCDMTGRLYKAKKMNLKDMNGNIEAMQFQSVLVW